MRRIRRLSLKPIGWLSVTLAGVCTLVGGASSVAREVEFDRDIRPILSGACFSCHGPDARARKAKLRLDTRAGVIRRRGRSVIAPGRSVDSELLRRLTTDDPDDRMPPAESGARLTGAEISLIARWIEAGAAYDEPWAFRKLRHDPAPQPVAGVATEWARGDIDRFVLARLEALDLEPSPLADRRTWIRRVSLDLRGVPPTIAELYAFLEDDSAVAREKIVDQFLADPRYAERRAQDWLDQARYADTSGFAADRYRSIWRFRDWVIEAFSDDMPFDDFTIAQLAGDLLENATDEDRVATGFHRNAMQAKGNNPRIEEFRIKGVVDRVNTTARVWLGLTFECAECHDHKYDEISQKDYYQLFAYFNNVPHLGKGFGVHGPRIQVLSTGDLDELEQLSRERAASQARLDDLLARVDVREDLSSWRPAAGADALVGAWLNGARVSSDSRARLPIVAELEGSDQPREDLTVTAWVRTRQGVADLVSKYDWRGRERAFVLGIGGQGEPRRRAGHLYAWISERADPFSGVEIEGSFAVNNDAWHHVALVFEAGRRVRLFVDGVEDGAALVEGKPPRRIAISRRPLAIGGGYANTSLPEAFVLDGDLSDVRLYRGAFVPPSDPRATALRGDVDRIDRRIRSIRQRSVETAVMSELAEPRHTYVLLRGNFESRGERVEPGLPTILAGSRVRQPRDRLELARWLVSRSNPLTARVTANRLWQQIVGRGLVATGADFGARGDRPTHPGLLDWLASSLVDGGWSVKAYLRDIVLSATYGQSSRASRSSRERDPENRWLARAQRRRLAAEQIRDVALSVSGLLDRSIGGSSVFPPQPPGIWEERGQSDAGNSNLKWKDSQGSSRHRRGLYTFWKRMSLYPAFLLFDAPTRERCVVERATTNSPMQALVLLNDEGFVEAARAFAQRVVESVEPDERVRFAFESVLSRLPTDEESMRFEAFLSAQSARFRASGKAARALSGEVEGDHAPELAAWTLALSSLLNLDETITRE